MRCASAIDTDCGLPVLDAFVRIEVQREAAAFGDISGQSLAANSPFLNRDSARSSMSCTKARSTLFAKLASLITAPLLCNPLCFFLPGFSDLVYKKIKAYIRGNSGSQKSGEILCLTRLIRFLSSLAHMKKLLKYLDIPQDITGKYGEKSKEGKCSLRASRYC